MPSRTAQTATPPPRRGFGSGGGPAAAFHRANALTYVSLLAALAAMAAAMERSASWAGALIALSVVADTFDGRFARLFTRSDLERASGMHLDSLSDAIAFGAAPIVCASLLTARPSAWAGVLWWTACVGFAACAITRLAFYNVTQDRSPGFTGLPAPVAALIWCSALLMDPPAILSSALLLLTALMMIAPLPVPRPTGYRLALFAAWPLAVIACHLA